MFPVPGNGSFDWLGYIPFEELPNTKNPSKGYIVTANNKITPPSWPKQYELVNNHDWDEHYRAYRIIQMLNETQSHTVDGQKLIQFNQVTGLWEDFSPFIPTMPGELLDDLGKSWKNAFLQWNGNESPDSVQATVFEFWYYELGRLGSETGVVSWGYPYFILNTLKNETSELCGGSCTNYAAAALTRAISAVGNKSPSNAPAWGGEKLLSINHMVMHSTPLACLFDRVVPYGGDSYTINVGAMTSKYTEESSHPFHQELGPSYRQIIDLSNMENSVFVFPMGQSGNLLDKNYDSLLGDYLNDVYVPMQTQNYGVSHTLTLRA